MVESETRCGILGPGRTRNGLGPFLAAWFERAGMRVVAGAGRDVDRTRAATDALAERLGHPVEPRAGIAGLLAPGDLDVVLIASPLESHFDALNACANASVHAYCEKPLVELEHTVHVPELCERFARAGRVLFENCQWPEFLSAFDVLHGGLPAAPDSVVMRLSPSGRGKPALVDSLSHFLSVLQACVPIDAEARIESCAFRTTDGSADANELTISLAIPHRASPVEGRLVLQRCESQPRPAWIEIDGRRVEREIEMPSYAMFARADAVRVPMDDPLVGSCIVSRKSLGSQQMTESSASNTESANERASSTTSSRPGETRRQEAIHDFTAKLRQTALWPRVVDYLKWQRALRKARHGGQADPELPDVVPLSINLDLTTACNYACDHCIDWDILNKKVRHADEELRGQMRELAARGMQSVILIGGGEPTLYPGFKEFVQYLKELHLQVAIVSNGSRNDKILEIAPYLTAGDWVRLSLDSGSNDVFQRMHNPSRKSLTLDEICAWIPKIKRANPSFQMGFSFVITWQGASRDAVRVVENIQEIEMASKRARDAQFDYISFKPFLERAETGSEVMDPGHIEGEMARVIKRIRESIDAAKALETPTFRVLESTNLRMLLEQSWGDFTNQPQVCHMQALRQVINPHGTFNCPAYRGVSYARVGERDAYKDRSSVREAVSMTQALLDNFDASENCKEVTCLYNQTNWWLEELCNNDVDLDDLEIASSGRDTFL